MSYDYQFPFYQCASEAEVIAEFGEQRVPHDFYYMGEDDAFNAKTKIFGDPGSASFQANHIKNCTLVGFGEDRSGTVSIPFNACLVPIIESAFRQIKAAELPYVLHAGSHVSGQTYRYRKTGSVYEAIGRDYKQKYIDANSAMGTQKATDAWHNYMWPIYSAQQDQQAGRMNNPISIDGKTKKKRDLLSNHAFGTAIDINSGNNPFSWNSKFDISKHIIAIMARHGFRWGGYFGDFMHFEYCLNRLITSTNDAWISDKTPLDESIICRCPTVFTSGNKVTQKAIDAGFDKTEKASKGGHYPIGRNGLWHGGVHLATSAQSPVYNSFSGTIVAARLNPQNADQYVGSNNFILTRHELNKNIFYCLYMHLSPIELDQKELSKKGILWTLPKPKVFYTVKRWQSVKCRSQADMWAGQEIGKLSDGERVTEISWEADIHNRAWLQAEKDNGEVVFIYGRTVSRCMEKEVDAKTFFTVNSGKTVDLRSLPGIKSNPQSKLITTLKSGDQVEKIATEPDPDGDPWYKVMHGATEGYILKSSESKGLVSSRQEPKDVVNNEILDSLANDGVAQLNIDIELGDTLWAAGEFGLEGKRTSGFHWEIFSENNIFEQFPNTHTAIDTDADYSMDSNEIIDLLAISDRTNPTTTAKEIANFFQSSPKRSELRRYACQFTSEWAIQNVEAALAKVPFKVKPDLPEKIKPYLWWQEASNTGVQLPSSSVTWHYNPVAFLELIGGVPKPLPQASFSPAIISNDSDKAWVKLRAYYDDKWQTPLTDLEVNVTQHSNGNKLSQTLTQGSVKNSNSNSLQSAQEASDESGIIVIEDIDNGDIDFEFARQSGVEREIESVRGGIEIRLDGAYRSLISEMTEFQQQWDQYGRASIILSGQDGLMSGAVDWVKAQEELFTAEFWDDIGSMISETARDVWDATGSYAEDTYNRIKDSAKNLAENYDDLDWWERLAEDTIDDISDMVTEKGKAIKSDVEQAVETLSNAATNTQKIITHRQAILDLPKHIASGNVDKVEDFVDVVLMDIDPELANEIINSPEWSIILELIADNESILLFLAYFTLFFEGIPPNFYAYLAGKGAGYVLLEILLLIICALLSSGAAAAGRIAMLSARLANLAAKTGKAGKTIKNGMTAIRSLARTVEDFAAAADEMHDLGRLLKKGRSSGLKYKGKTGTTIEAKKEQTKREKKCRICGAINKSTPRHRRGTVEYA